MWESMRELKKTAERQRRISGPIPNAHLFFEYPQDVRNEILAGALRHAMETAQQVIRMHLMSAVFDVAKAKGIEMDLNK